MQNHVKAETEEAKRKSLGRVFERTGCTAEDSESRHGGTTCHIFNGGAHGTALCGKWKTELKRKNRGQASSYCPAVCCESHRAPVQTGTNTNPFYEISGIPKIKPSQHNMEKGVCGSDHHD